MLVCREVDADVLCKFYEKQMRRTAKQREKLFARGMSNMFIVGIVAIFMLNLRTAHY